MMKHGLSIVRRFKRGLDALMFLFFVGMSGEAYALDTPVPLSPNPVETSDVVTLPISNSAPLVHVDIVSALVTLGQVSV